MLRWADAPTRWLPPARRWLWPAPRISRSSSRRSRRGLPRIARATIGSSQQKNHPATFAAGWFRINPNARSQAVLLLHDQVDLPFDKLARAPTEHLQLRDVARCLHGGRQIGGIIAVDVCDHVADFDADLLRGAAVI